MTHVLEVMDASGHLTLTWDPDKPDEVAQARAEFARLKAAGFAFFATACGGTEDAQTVKRLGTTGELRVVPEQVKAFAPHARRTVAVRPMRGG